MILKIKGQDEPKPEKELIFYLESSGKNVILRVEGPGGQLLEFYPSGKVRRISSVHSIFGFNLDPDGRLIIE